MTFLSLSFNQLDVDRIISFLISPNFSGWLLVIKIVFIVISFIFFVLIFFYLLKTTWFRWRFLANFVEFFIYRPYGTKKLTKQWAKILARLETELESEYKLAVIEADSMFDDILKEMGYGGESLGERLKKITSAIVPNIEQVWHSHKIRNNIVHDPTYRLKLEEARKAIAAYEKALIDLGAL